MNSPSLLGGRTRDGSHCRSLLFCFCLNSDFHYSEYNGIWCPSDYEHYVWKFLYMKIIFYIFSLPHTPSALFSETGMDCLFLHVEILQHHSLFPSSPQFNNPSYQVWQVYMMKPSPLPLFPILWILNSLSNVFSLKKFFLWRRCFGYKYLQRVNKFLEDKKTES